MDRDCAVPSSDQPVDEPGGQPGDTDTRLERGVTLGTEPDVAWELLTSPDDLEGWLGVEVVLDPTPGAEGEVLDHDGTRRRLVVEEVRPGERISWRWWIDDDGAEPDPSRVEITLTPASGGTRVDIVEHRIPAGTITARAGHVGTASHASARVWGRRLLHLELVSLLASGIRV